MPIRLICVCGRDIVLQDDFAGHKVRCPECGAALQIPSKEDDLKLTRFYCVCGQRLKAHARAAGRAVSCPRCGKKTIVPSMDAKSVPIMEEFELDGEAGIVELNPEDAPEVTTAAVPQPPPSPAPPPTAEIAAEIPDDLLLKFEEPIELIPSGENAAATYELGRSQPPPVPPLPAADAPPRAARKVRAVRIRSPAAPQMEDVEEGLSARELAEYFNAESGVDAAKAGITDVLHGHWLWLPYALLGTIAWLLIMIFQKKFAGQTAPAIALGALGIACSAYLMAGFIGCIKDGIFGRAMGVGRLLRHGAVHFLRFVGACLLMTPISAALIFLLFLAFGFIINQDHGFLLEVLLSLVFGLVVLFFFELIFIPIIVAIVEQINPISAVGRGLKFIARNILRLLTMSVAAVVLGGGGILMIRILWNLSGLLRNAVLPGWLNLGLDAFVYGFLSAALVSLIISSVIVLYLSQLSEERLQAIQSKFRGAVPPAWHLYVAVIMLACGVLALSHLAASHRRSGELPHEPASGVEPAGGALAPPVKIQPGRDPR